MISWSVDKMLKHWINMFSAFGGKAANKKFLPGIKTYVSKNDPKEANNNRFYHHLRFQ